ncbi:DUF3311 domain-containing protein [Halobiforma nitratireducens]|uniref:DUF3311 domain-containing protein n=1 Tax=Halobiforma nitratireducens JCM 10879 TaxID=1227454 RepID=M0L618_9EURY|nr:DUF3311 domain-containing protein [Halobiforma nitratireducens]EMA27440.1 hypothetical protein C446_17676 [Halobiforma nitratireducens JCM 10879]
MRRLELVGWIAVAVVLSALSIPWFLWGDATLVAGVPLWLWWHVGWMLLASVVFWLFARRAWGIGIEPPGSSGDGRGERTASRSGSGGEQP